MKYQGVKIETFTKAELYCLARQVKFFYRYYWVGKTETEEPCYRCPLQLVCDFHFIEVFQKLGRMAGEEINLMSKRTMHEYSYALEKEPIEENG